LFTCPILTNENERLAHFTTGGELEGDSASRKKARKEIKEENEKKRSVGASDYGDRGHTLEEEISLCSIRTIEAGSIQEYLTEARRTYHGELVIL